MAFKTIIKVYSSGQGKNLPRPGVRGGTPQAVPDTEITGEVFSLTVTGQTLEEVTAKAEKMLQANVAASQGADDGTESWADPGGKQ